MANNSAIEWTQSTWNPIAGCTPVSPGCLHCYAATMSHRLEGMGQEKYRGLTVLRNGVRTFNGKISFDEDALTIPLKRRKPTVYFVNSMSDLFHKDVPFDFIDKVFAVMALCPQHTFQVLTKRPERMAEYLREKDTNGNLAYHRVSLLAIEQLPGYPSSARRNFNMRVVDGRFWPLPNVWIGTSVENQECADARIPHLLKCPAAVRFLSCEPLLGAVSLNKGCGEFLSCPSCGYTPRDVREQMDHRLCNGDGPGIHWVIVGGESGPGARPCDVAWIRSIVSQCKAAGVSCFVKQLGADPFWDYGPDHEGTAPRFTHFNLKDKKGGNPDEWAADLRVREMPVTL